MTRTQTTDSIVIRRATEADRVAMERLAQLDSASMPAGGALVAEVAGEPVAAIEIETGAAIADPFHRTADVVELLTLRAARMRATASPRPRLALPRPAWRAA